MLFLGCENLSNLFSTVAHGSGNFQGLEIHSTNSYLATNARNIFILWTICRPHFYPKNAADLGYIWDVIYNATWSDSTKKRFMQDVKKLRDSSLPQNIIIPGNFHEELKDLWTEWLSMDSLICGFSFCGSCPC